MRDQEDDAGVHDLTAAPERNGDSIWQVYITTIGITTVSYLRATLKILRSTLLYPEKKRLLFSGRFRKEIHVLGHV